MALSSLLLASRKSFLLIISLSLSHSLPFLPHPNQESSLHLFQTKMNKEYSMMLSYGGAGGAGGGGGGPCGACKYLRRKCVKGCVFAPYFDSDQGTAHFAAVHRVFGASNASKLLMRTPPHCRLDAVITLCYEALARVRDPVYGCVAHVFTLQQQVVNLQAELAYTQARISTLQRAPPPAPAAILSPPPPEMVSLSNSVEEEVEDLQSLAREYVSRYFPGVRFRPPT